MQTVNQTPQKPASVEKLHYLEKLVAPNVEAQQAVEDELPEEDLEADIQAVAAIFTETSNVVGTSYKFLHDHKPSAPVEHASLMEDDNHAMAESAPGSGSLYNGNMSY